MNKLSDLWFCGLHVYNVHFFCFSSSSELRTGGPPAGSRPAEDEAGRHAAGRPGPDLTPGPHAGPSIHTGRVMMMMGR